MFAACGRFVSAEKSHALNLPVLSVAGARATEGGRQAKSGWAWV